jgi:hypothetical protein
VGTNRFRPLTSAHFAELAFEDARDGDGNVFGTFRLGSYRSGFWAHSELAIRSDCWISRLECRRRRASIE